MFLRNLQDSKILRSLSIGAPIVTIHYVLKRVGAMLRRGYGPSALFSLRVRVTDVSGLIRSNRPVLPTASRLNVTKYCLSLVRSIVSNRDWAHCELERRKRGDWRDWQRHREVSEIPWCLS